MKYSYDPDEPEKSIEQLQSEEEIYEWKREKELERQEEDEIRLQELREESDGWKQEDGDWDD